MAAADQGWAAPPLAPPGPKRTRRPAPAPGELRRSGAPPETAPREDARGETAPPETAPPETAPPETAPPETAPPETAPPETARGEDARGEDARAGQEPRAGRPPADRESLVGPARLAEFFAPRSIAVVGASDHSAWARFVLAAAAATGFTGDLIPVHHVRRTVFGRPAIASLRDLAEPADIAFIMVPTDAVESVLDDAGAAGVRGAIVLAAGYRETGEAGRALEERLATRAASHGITLLGPNCLGFLNAHAHAGPFALTVPPPLLAGPVGIALQSGALASVMLSFARSRAIGVSTLATLGNEAMMTATDMIDFLAEDEHTREDRT